MSAVIIPLRCGARRQRDGAAEIMALVEDIRRALDRRDASCVVAVGQVVPFLGKAKQPSPRLVRCRAQGEAP